MDGVKKEKEWLVLQYFREKYAGFPKGRLLKSESPDFIVRQGRKRGIGIEMTRLDAGQKRPKDHWEKQLIYLLDKKEVKLKRYKKQLLNEYWLLIVVESIDLAQIDPDKLHLNSGFNKVLLFDLFSANIKELSL